MVAAMRSPQGASAAVLMTIRSGEVSAVASVALALEYESVCRRAEHQRAAGLSDEEVEVFVDAVIAIMEPVRSHFLWRPQLRDPNDEMVLESAINGRASLLVTFNTKDFDEARRFGIDVMVPREALRRLRQ